MSNVPSDLRYTKDHEWVKLDGTTAKIGVTDFAQSELGEIVFVEVPSIGRSMKQSESFSVLESTKAASDVYTPVSGTVKAVNANLSGNPTLVNSDPYGEGWLAILDGVSPSELETLMTAEQYKKHIGQ